MRTIFLALLTLSGTVAVAQITATSFATKFDLSLGTYTSVNSGFISDLDGDSKPEIIAFTNRSASQSAISIFQNISTPGALSSASFNPRIEILTSANTTNGYAEDLDGDGKKDLIVNRFTGTSAASFSYYLNTGSPGTISFGTAQTTSVPSSISNIVLKDMDGDGKKDAVLSMWYTREVRVYLNTSTPGAISFSTTPYSIGIGSSGGLIMLVCDDLNADSKPDVALCNYDNGVLHILKNTSTNGAVSFATPVTYSTGSAPGRISSGDIDGDGLPDLLVSNNSSSNIGIYKNVSTGTTIAFNNAVTYGLTASSPTHLHLADFDKNGKPDLVVSNSNTSNVSVFSNFGIPGTINSTTLANRKEFSTAAGPEAFVGDMDADGKTDIVTINQAGNVSILRNIIIPSNDLVARYDFTGNTGDSSGYENHATGYPGATLTADRKGQANSAYSFNGTSTAYIQTAGTPSLNTATASNFTVSGWFKPASGTTGQPNAVAWIFLAGNNDNYALSYSLNTNKFSFQNWVASTLQLRTNLINKAALPRDVWYHIAIRIDSTNRVSMFINGALDTSETFIPLKPVMPTFTIGKNPSAGVPNNWAFLGGIDEVKVYRRYVTDTEILALSGNNQKKYYSKSAGALNQLSTWGSNPDGSGTSPFSFDSSNVIYYVHNNSSPGISGSLKIGGSGSTLVMGDGITAFNFGLLSSDTLSCDSVYLNSNITVTAHGTFICPKLASATASSVQFLGTGTQNMPAGSYYNLVVNGGTKTLTGNTSVKNTFGMFGSVNNPSFSFMLGTDTANRGSLSRGSGTIYGSFSRWFTNTANTGNTGLFPIGNATKYAPFSIDFTTAPSAGGMVTAEFIASNPGSTGLPIFDIAGGFLFIDKAAIDGYWRLTSNIGTGTYNASATTNNFTGVNAFQDLRLMKRNTSGSWTIPGNAGTNTGNNASAVVIRTGLNTGLAGEYGIGGDQSVNPLPVGQLSFKVLLSTNREEALLNWTAAYEINNKGFEVQRSTDNHTFVTIGEVEGKGTTANISVYRYSDDITSLRSENTKTIFYRLKQTDLDGAFTYSNTVSVQLNGDHKNAFMVYPNPANKLVHITGLEQPAFIYDLLGNKLMELEQNGVTDISALKSGVYFIQSGTLSQKLVKN